MKNNPEIWWGEENYGSGQLGSPGDPTSPSRFIRASVLTQSVFEPQNTQQSIGLARQILETLTVPHGTVLDSNGADKDHTLWSVIRDHTNCNYYFYSDFNSKLFGIHLKQLDFEAAKQKQIIMIQPGWYEDITHAFKAKCT